MRKFLFLAALAALAAVPAQAADLPAKAIVKASPFAPAASPFYIGTFLGAGFSKTENELTILGTPMGPVSAYPTGIMAGGVFGYANNSGPVYFGAVLEAAYDFSRGDVGGINPGTVIGARRNGLFLAEVGELGLNLAALGGYIPGPAQPSNWPVPIVVPASVWGNLVVAARGGLAQRSVTLCAVDGTLNPDGSLHQDCGSKFITGPLVGGKIKAMISANTEVFLTYDHVFWNSSFTPAATAPIFAATIAAKDEDLFRAGLGYHF